MISLDIPVKVKCSDCKILGDYTDEEYEIFKKVLPRVVLLKTGTYVRGANQEVVSKTSVRSAIEYLGAGFKSKNMNSLTKGVSGFAETDDLLKMCDDGRGMEEFSQCRRCSRVKVQNLDEKLVAKKKEENRVKLLESFHEQMTHQEKEHVSYGRPILEEQNEDCENNHMMVEEEKKMIECHKEIRNSNSIIVMDERDLMLGNIQISGGNDENNADNQHLRKRMIIINPEKTEETLVRKKLPVLTNSFSPLPGDNQIIVEPVNNNNSITQQEIVYTRKKILQSTHLRNVINKYNAMNNFNSLYRLYKNGPSKFFSMHKSDFGGKPKRRIFRVFRNEYKSTVLKC